jgi:branched-chain amino acid transport system permease protein
VPALLQVAVAVALVVPIIPLVARIALQPIADASVLVPADRLARAAFPALGPGPAVLRPEGSRTAPLVGGAIAIVGFSVNGQVLLMVGAALVLSALFFLAFERTVGRQGAARDRGQPHRRPPGRHPPARTALLALRRARRCSRD